MKKIEDYRTSITNLKLDKDIFNIIDSMSLYKNGYRETYKDKNGNVKEKGNYIGYQELDMLIKNLVDNKEIKPYRELPAQISQQTIRKLDKNVKSFFSLLNKKKFKEYNKPIEMPEYLPKNGRKEIMFAKESFKIENGYIYISVPKDLYEKRIKLCKVPTYINESKIKYLEIIPKLNRYELHITYKIEYSIEPKDVNNWLSIDLGINNFCTIASNVQNAYIINGKPIKSMNKKFNKDLAKAKSILKKNQKRYMSKRIAQLYTKRSNRLNNEISKITNFIIESIKKNNIDHVIIGYNKGWKDKSSMTRYTNQTFIQIPYTKLIDKM